LKFFNNTDIAIDFLDNAMMNKTMGFTTINEDDYLLVPNVANELDDLGIREESKGTQQN
jgi:hypothetical protein